MFPYAVETFTSAEEDILRRYCTNLHLPVFALVNLPEVVKGALFARYSRSPKSLRRLFLDEFVGELDITGDATVDATVGLKRAEDLYEKVFLEYGDDSVAQLGGVHLACEQASNVLTKVLERGRLMAYLEQSTRYIAYDSRLSTGHYRYCRDPGLLESPLGAKYVGEMDRMFDTYGELLAEVQAWLTRRHPRQAGDSDFVHRRAVRAKALDALRGLLPAGSLSNLGIYGTGQSYEMLLLRMRAHPLPEARSYAAMMLDELRKVIPSFLQRVDRPERGGEWSRYFEQVRDDTARTVERLFPDLAEAAAPTAGPTGAADGRPRRLRSRGRGEGHRRHLLSPCLRVGSGDPPPGARARRRRTSVAGPRLCRGPVQSSPPARAGLRADVLSFRRRDRLRRLPGPAAPSDADHRVAAARSHPRL